MILILHLSIIQAATRVLIPSDTLSGLLWIEVAKTALFRSLLHINAARKLAAGHLMRWQQLFLRYFLAPILPVRFNMHVPLSRVSCRVTLGSRIAIWSVLHSSEENNPPWTTFPDLSTRMLLIEFWTWYPYCYLLVLGPINVLGQNPRPNIQFWALIPTIFL